MDPKYQSILHTPWPQPTARKRLPEEERAVQFAPFSALTGYDGVIGEAGRLTQGPVFLTEESLQALNETLKAIREHLDRQSKVKMTVYRADRKKEGGALLPVEGQVKKIDLYEGRLILTDGREIPFSQIVEIEEVPEDGTAL